MRRRTNADGRADAAGVLGGRRAVLTIVVAVALSAVAVALLGAAADYHDLLHALTHADKRWLPLCALGELLAYGGYIVAYRDVASARGGPRFDLWTATRVVVVGFGAFVLGSGAGGLAVDYWALRRADEPPEGALRRVLAITTLEWAVLAALAALAAATLLATGADVPVAMTGAWLGVVLLASAAAAWLTAGHRAERLARAVSAERTPATGVRWLAARARNGLGHVLAGTGLVRELLAHPIRHRGAILGFVAYWCGDVVCIEAALRAFGSHLPVAAVVVGYATGYVITALPLPAGAAGASEATTSFALHAAGAPLSSALLAVLVFRVFTFWLPIAPAIAFVPTVRRLGTELAEQRAPA